MPVFRLPVLASLARQLAFAPLDVRHAQLAAAEALLYEMDPARSYPPDYVTFRITGYQPRTRVQDELLTGLALQHDLGVLIEQVSAGMQMLSAEVDEPVLSIDDVTARFNVTSKTIQRWRRKGLVSRRFIFPDGKSRVGFLLSSIERFIRKHSASVCDQANLSAMGDEELAAIVRNARRLVTNGRISEHDLTMRLARKFRRSPLTILHTLRKHDQQNVNESVLPLVVKPLGMSRRVKIARAFRQGRSIARIACRSGCSQACVYRAVLDDRLARLARRRATFHDDELYHGADAEMAVRDIVRAVSADVSVSLRDMSSESTRIPPRLPPYIADLYRTPLFTPAQERAAFLEFNFRKFEFVQARRQFDPETARWRDVQRLERLAKAANGVKNRIVAANLRLVVSVARRHVSGASDLPPTLMELVSEGNLILMRAAESFDLHKNVRFSTYATLALMKGFARLVPELRSRAQSAAHDVGELELADGRSNPSHDHLAHRDEVNRLMAMLSPTERQVITAQFGLDRTGRPKPTHDQLAQDLGVSRHRVRLLERSALAKLRSAHTPA
jgi:RNA polymerase primary sigma factor